MWIPKRVVITEAALEHRWGRAIAERCANELDLPVEESPGNRITGLKGKDDRDTYRRAKSTLAVVASPPSARKLQPIPPSADWQFHLARGCPAHCQYCYLAGSLPGPPVTRVFANLDEILDGLPAYAGTGEVTSTSKDRADEGTTFEASCYTDPLGIEHLTGSLAETVRWFGKRDPAERMSLRFTTKFDAVDELARTEHNGRTRARFSVNARPVAVGFEGGTANMPRRLQALRKLAEAQYPVGLTIAPIMPVEDWPSAYAQLLDDVAQALHGIPDVDLTVELITHRFTATSKEVLNGWYPASRLEMDEEVRTLKRTKFGAKKFVYPRELMKELRTFFEDEVGRRLPGARILYFT